jgi:RNA polymerase-binding transcription factor DksA
MDEVDHANELADAFREHQLRLVSLMSAPEQDPSNLNPYCCDCGVEIEEGRLKLLKKRCLHCQALFERRNKLFGSY